MIHFYDRTAIFWCVVGWFSQFSNASISHAFELGTINFHVPYVKTMNAKNTKKSLIHENADANITCDFGDNDISHSRSRFTHTHTHTHARARLAGSMIVRQYTLYSDDEHLQNVLLGIFYPQCVLYFTAADLLILKQFYFSATATERLLFSLHPSSLLN